ncbi:hypothetical protein M427DRAFT_338890 [Gonapodya prolifera JEL478]|uniref:Uncharacterized protein n=1 Tax=Gonapodya prolifera (strain JEL478) TaxID=1344416 RepID=A0A139ADQ7_GONPJ|nr:hypothetical protein M427DRAFT_338890 [Gonapodya prolifera JEL478]|eukprot:KXS14553.1 hypothetical protein M427DRAFT_338890 [Gonapodya prolifera JEL478]
MSGRVECASQLSEPTIERYGIPSGFASYIPNFASISSVYFTIESDMLPSTYRISCPRPARDPFGFAWKTSSTCTSASPPSGVTNRHGSFLWLYHRQHLSFLPAVLLQDVIRDIISRSDLVLGQEEEQEP